MASPASWQDVADSRLTPASTSSDSKSYFWFVASGLTVLYWVAAIFMATHRFVWFDELFTMDIARAANLHQLWEWSLKFDNNPAASYLPSRISMHVLGATPLGLRLPVMVAFYLGSVAVFLYVRRKAGVTIAAFAALLLCGSETFFYATEARPYALVFMAWAWLLLSWDSAVTGQKRVAAITGVAVSTSILLASYVLAPFSLLPFLAGEAVRTIRRRKVDVAVWGAMLAPCILILAYIPLILAYRGILVWPDLRASWAAIGRFYYATLRSAAMALVVAVPVLLILLRIKREARIPAPARPEEWAIFLSLLLNPVIVNLVMMRQQGGFYDRYCLTSSVTICLLLALLVARYLKRFLVTVGAGTAAAALGLVVCSMAPGGRSLLQRTYERANLGLQRRYQKLRFFQASPIPFQAWRPDLPLVDGSGVTFYEMSHHEPPEILKRLFYLKDRAASIAYEGTNYFQDFEAPDDMQRAGFPISGHVEPYSEFVRRHRQFLLFGAPGQWIVVLLQQEGAQLSLLRDYSDQTPYYSSKQLYLVTLPDQPPRQ